MIETCWSVFKCFSVWHLNWSFITNKCFSWTIIYSGLKCTVNQWKTCSSVLWSSNSPHCGQFFSPWSQIIEPFDRIHSRFHSIRYTSLPAITYILTVLSTCRCYLLNHSSRTWRCTTSEAFRMLICWINGSSNIALPFIFWKEFKQQRLIKSIITDYPVGIQVDGIFHFSDLMRSALNTGLLHWLPSKFLFVITNDK
jgi:hypothetical protein